MSQNYRTLILMCITIVGLSSGHLYPQAKDSQEVKYQTNVLDSSSVLGTSVYFEFLGKGFYSLNVDHRGDATTAMSLGFQYAENAFIPSFMYYHFSGDAMRTEIGGGVSAALTKQDGLAGIALNGVYGYRYQKKNGLLFRIGFTPLIGIPLTHTGRFMVVPLVGMSLGYSF